MHDHVPLAVHVHWHSANWGPVIAHRSPGVQLVPEVIAGHVEQLDPIVSG